MTSPSSEKTVSARRRLFQIMAVGGTAAIVLPEKWVKPVIDAVIVPAHAAGSVVRTAGIYGNSGVGVGSNSASVLDRFAGMFMSSAHAATSTCANTPCISFDIPAASQTPVRVSIWALDTPGSTFINPNNTLDPVTVGQLKFSNLSLSVVDQVLTGRIDANTVCVSGTFSFPRVSNVCSSAPTMPK